MPTSRSHSRKDSKKQATQRTQTLAPTSTHHGIRKLPSELLVHVTSSLDPKSLLSLGCVDHALHLLIADDHTWAVAFKLQFLGRSPEAGLSMSDSLLLRRSEITWRKEYLKHWTLIRRFSKSRSATISHTPLHGVVSSMLLLPDKGSLLASSLTYGVVSRSFAFTGKILKGFLDAHGALNGQGIGNPNAEFAPDVNIISCHSSGGGTAKVAWGFLGGTVAVTTAPKVMDLGKSAKFVKCRPGDGHDGLVTCLVFGESSGTPGSTIVSADARGSVKLWETRRMRCLWTGNVNEAPSQSAVPVPVPTVAVKAITYCASSGSIIAACLDGDICVWSGFDVSAYSDFEQGRPEVTTTVSPRCKLRIPRLESETAQVSGVYLQRSTTGTEVLNFAVLYAELRHAWRVSLSIPLGGCKQTWRSTKFVGPLGGITCVYFDALPLTCAAENIQAATPLISTSILVQPKHVPVTASRSFLIAGDALGCVYVWDWDGEPRELDDVPQLESCWKWTAHEDGPVTSINVDGCFVATGSAKGTISVWDLLTLKDLRTFAAPTQRTPVENDHQKVSQIILNQDVLIASIGPRVFAWKAESPRHDKNLKSKGKKTARRVNPTAKWQEEVEMRRDITESRDEIGVEDAFRRDFNGREKEQRTALDALGLDEIEAVEYALMLSREDEEAKLQSMQTSLSSTMPAADPELDDDLLFEMTDDFEPAPRRSQHDRSSSASPTSSLFYTSTTRTPSSYYVTPIPSPRFTSSRSSPAHSSPIGSSKISVSPRPRQEPMEAGFSSNSVVGMSPSSIGRPNVWQIPSGVDAFPALFGSERTTGRSTSASLAEWGSNDSDQDPAGSRRTSPRVSRSTSVSSSAIPSSIGSISSASGQRSWSAVAKSSTHASLQRRLSITERSSGAGLSSHSSVALHMGPSLLATSLAGKTSAATRTPRDEEEELAWVLKLSLVEAQSRADA